MMIMFHKDFLTKGTERQTFHPVRNIHEILTNVGLIMSIAKTERSLFRQTYPGRAQTGEISRHTLIETREVGSRSEKLMQSRTSKRAPPKTENHGSLLSSILIRNEIDDDLLVRHSPFVILGI
jgi:hypothetical protein